MQCTHCGSLKFNKNGKYKGDQRYICKECSRSFSNKIRKFTYADKEHFLDLYLNNVGIRKASKIIKCSPSLLVRWTKELAKHFKRQLEKANNNASEKEIPDIIEMDEIYTRVKKGLTKCRFGLLILEDDVKLLRIK